MSLRQINNCKKLLFFIFLFIQFQSFCQKGYGNGYIITNENDSLSGYLKDRKEGYSPKLNAKIKFKGDGFSSKKYGPKQILRYSINGNVYESIWLDKKSFLFKEYYISQVNRGEKVFLRLVINGYLKLYYLEYIDAESGIFEYIELFKRQDEDFLVRSTQGILGLKKKLLSDYFKDCTELVEKINSKEIKTAIDVALFYNDFVKK